jgi:hypothetical protein
VQEYHGKIKDAKDGVNVLIADSKQASSKINKEACDRMMQNLIGSRKENTEINSNNIISNTNRKLNKSAPVPEQLHMTWQKDTK